MNHPPNQTITYPSLASFLVQDKPTQFPVVTYFPGTITAPKAASLFFFEFLGINHTD